MLTKELIKQFLKPSRKNFLVLIFFVALFLVYFYFFIIQCIYTQGIDNAYFCYTINKTERKTCYKKTDCGEGQKCILEGVNMMPALGSYYSIEKRWLKDTIYKDSGVCREYQGIGCNTEINEDGSIGASGCSDAF